MSAKGGKKEQDNEEVKTVLQKTFFAFYFHDQAGRKGYQSENNLTMQ
jgi:hypothetical protein